MLKAFIAPVFIAFQLVTPAPFSLPYHVPNVYATPNAPAISAPFDLSYNTYRGLLRCPICVNAKLASVVMPMWNLDYYDEVGFYHPPSSPIQGSTPSPGYFKTFICSQGHTFNMVFVCKGGCKVPDHFEYIPLDATSKKSP